MKFKIIVFIVLSLLLFACQGEEIVDQPLEVNYEKTIVAFGDSLTEGLGLPENESYPFILEKKLQENNYSVKVYNSGSSGETSTAAKNRVDWVKRLNPDKVILVIGANDAIRGIDLSITKNNILEIIDSFRSDNVTVILAGLEIYKNLGADYANSFEQMYKDIAAERDVVFIESFLGRVAGDSSLNQDDEIHPTYQGYQVIVNENVFSVVEAELSK